MPMVSFHDRCPATALRDLRYVVALPAGDVPAGEYLFVELYCNVPDCNCRRVMFMVYARKDLSTPLATLNYGWESAAFYTKWLHGDEVMGEEMTRLTLEPFGEQSEYSEGLRKLAELTLVNDLEYVERLKRHYAEFRATLPCGSKPRGLSRTPPRQKKRK